MDSVCSTHSTKQEPLTFEICFYGAHLEIGYGRLNPPAEVLEPADNVSAKEIHCT